MKQSTLNNSNEKIASFIDNDAVNEKLISFRISHSKKTKEEIHNMIFPHIKKLIQMSFAKFKEYWEDLYQAGGLVINEFIEKPSYDPKKGGSFYAYIKKKVISECWNAVYFSTRPLSCNEKAAASMHSAIKKLREENPTFSDEDLVMLYTEKTSSGLKIKSIEEKYQENLDLFRLAQTQTYVRTIYKDGREIFDNLSYDEISGSNDTRGEVIEVCEMALELYRLPKSDPNHLTDLERKTIIISCMNALLHRGKSAEELAGEIGVLPSSFSRAHSTASIKIRRALWNR